MHLVKGKTRLVLVFPALGIVIKLPITEVKYALTVFASEGKNRRGHSLRIHCRWLPECSYVFAGMIFKGVIANLRERIMYKRTHHPFLQPTIFSLFGFLNVQRYGVVCVSDCLSFWDQIRSITRQEAYTNPHQFSEPGNYCVDKGKLRIMDYGGRGSARIVLKYGRRIQEEFNFNFRYSEPTGKN